MRYSKEENHPNVGAYFEKVLAENEKCYISNESLKKVHNGVYKRVCGLYEVKTEKLVEKFESQTDEKLVTKSKKFKNLFKFIYNFHLTCYHKTL